MTGLFDIAGGQFVALTTFRTTGVGIPTPVWIARDGDSLVITTDVETGKVKRLRHDPRVELRPSDARGKVAADAPLISGIAEIITAEPQQSQLRELIAGKYGIQYTLLTAMTKRKRRENRCILRITQA